MRFRSERHRDRPEVNLIAFIDVLLVILIFLMVSTTFSRFSALQVSLPTAGERQSALPASVAVAVDADGRFAVDNRRIEARDPAALALALKDAAGTNPDCVVEIRADAMASHQSVVNVMEAARLAGLPKLVFATQAAPASR
ncbi:MAG: biopolymer transporter ExbD [Burkholderiaceae bacterium]|nr:biopolymer transporter ExbD [Burkholderiaceae bacterium]